MLGRSDAAPELSPRLTVLVQSAFLLKILLPKSGWRLNASLVWGSPMPLRQRLVRRWKQPPNDGPGLESPGPDSTGLNSTGLNSTGLNSAGPDATGLMQPQPKPTCSPISSRLPDAMEEQQRQGLDQMARPQPISHRSPEMRCAAPQILSVRDVTRSGIPVVAPHLVQRSDGALPRSANSWNS